MKDDAEVINARLVQFQLFERTSVRVQDSRKTSGMLCTAVLLQSRQALAQRSFIHDAML